MAPMFTIFQSWQFMASCGGFYKRSQLSFRTSGSGVEAQYHGCGHQLLPHEGGEAATAAETPQRRGHLKCMGLRFQRRELDNVHLKGPRKTTTALIAILWFNCVQCQFNKSWTLGSGVSRPSRAGKYERDSPTPTSRHPGFGQAVQIQAWA